MDAGDHEIALCRVDQVISSSPGRVLSTDLLRRLGEMRCYLCYKKQGG
jgi:hypothetical protein